MATEPKPASRIAAVATRIGRRSAGPPRVAAITVPGVERAVRQQRQDDEGRDQQADAGIDVVPADLGDEPVQGLLVGQHRGGHHAEPDRQVAVTEHGHGTKQADRDSRKLGGEAQRVRPLAGHDHVAREDLPCHGEHGHRQQPDESRGLRQIPRDSADQRHQNERAQAGDAWVVFLRLALLALDADQGSDQQRGGEVAQNA